MACWYSPSSLARSNLYVDMWGHGFEVSLVAWLLTVSLKALRKAYGSRIQSPLNGSPDILTVSKEQGIKFLESSTNSLSHEVI